MKRCVAAFAALVLVLLLTGCTSEKSLYGTWYNDSDGTRNAVQFSENDDGKSVFIWAVYDIENDETTSQTGGYYHVSGKNISFEYSDGSESLELQFELSGETLKLYNDSSSLTLTLYTIE